MSNFVTQRYQDRQTTGLGIAQIEGRTRLSLDDPASATSSLPVLVRVEKLGPRQWQVRNAEGSRGGLFQDYAAAMKFVRREFAALQPTVVEMLLD
jgi:hypothetical protein